MKSVKGLRHGLKPAHRNRIKKDSLKRGRKRKKERKKARQNYQVVRDATKKITNNTD
jgi:hypothetical protein